MRPNDGAMLETVDVIDKPRVRHVATSSARLLLYPCQLEIFLECSMSIYRRFDRLPSNDMHAQRAKRHAPAEAQATAHHSASPKEQYRGVRKATPASEPLPRTLEWSASLPLDVRPTALLHHYGRIANVIAAIWRDPKSLQSYMDCLFTDDRGDRQGFPADVLHELLALREYYDSLDAENRSTWTAVPKRG